MSSSAVTGFDDQGKNVAEQDHSQINKKPNYLNTIFKTAK